MAKKIDALRALLDALAKRETGFTIPELGKDHAAAVVERELRERCMDGRLNKATIGHRTVRYFGQARWASTYMVEAKALVPSTVRVRTARAGWAAPPKGVITPVEGVTKRTKFTVGPSFNASAVRTNTHEA